MFKKSRKVFVIGTMIWLLVSCNSEEIAGNTPTHSELIEIWRNPTELPSYILNLEPSPTFQTVQPSQKVCLTINQVNLATASEITHENSLDLELSVNIRVGDQDIPNNSLTIADALGVYPVVENGEVIASVSGPTIYCYLTPNLPSDYYLVTVQSSIAPNQNHFYSWVTFVASEE